MKPFMILAVLDEKRRGIYEEFLAREHVACRIVTSLRDVVIQAAKHLHVGILVDMPIVVKASHFDKGLAEDALRALPSARVNISRKSGEILMLVMGAGTGIPVTAPEFVRYCRNRTPRIVHVRNRVPLHLNALLARTADMSEAEKTVCIDFSEGGCFLFSTDELLVPETTVWIRLLGLQDESPIQGMICWKRVWGNSDVIPGVGIRFDVLTDSQQSEIVARAKQKRGT
jgi:hypothetical protein